MRKSAFRMESRPNQSLGPMAGRPLCRTACVSQGCWLRPLLAGLSTDALSECHPSLLTQRPEACNEPPCGQPAVTL